MHDCCHVADAGLLPKARACTVITHHYHSKSASREANHWANLCSPCIPTPPKVPLFQVLLSAIALHMVRVHATSHSVVRATQLTMSSCAFVPSLGSLHRAPCMVSSFPAKCIMGMHTLTRRFAAAEVRHRVCGNHSWDCGLSETSSSTADNVHAIPTLVHNSELCSGIHQSAGRHCGFCSSHQVH